MDAAESHRESKKRRTRQAIVAAAMERFQSQGFEATTIADIAALADIAPRTFFAYFPSKEDVVFHDFEVALESMRERFASREAGEDAFEALRGWIAEMVEEIDPNDESERARQRLIADNPSLRDHDRALRGTFQEALAEALNEDFDELGELRSRMVAAASVAALDSVAKAEVDLSGRLDEDPMQIVDEALAFIRAGTRALHRPE